MQRQRVMFREAIQIAVARVGAKNPRTEWSNAVHEDALISY